jgi:hypothetical protein
MFAKATALVAIVATLVSAHAAPDLQPGSLATRQDCTSTPGVTLRAGEWTKVEGLDNDQGGFGGPGGEWQLPLVQGSYGEERFTLITYQVGTGSWSDAVDAPQNLQEDKRFEVRPAGDSTSSLG